MENIFDSRLGNKWCPRCGGKLLVVDDIEAGLSLTCWACGGVACYAERDVSGVLVFAPGRRQPSPTERQRRPGKKCTEAPRVPNGKISFG